MGFGDKEIVALSGQSAGADLFQQLSFLTIAIYKLARGLFVSPSSGLQNNVMLVRATTPCVHLWLISMGQPKNHLQSSCNKLHRPIRKFDDLSKSNCRSTHPRQSKAIALWVWQGEDKVHC